MDLPQRGHLPHEIPLWIDPQKEVYYLTINCERRGTNQLATAETANAILRSIAWRQERGLWFAHLFLIMPDHAHALISFPPSTRTAHGVVCDWKRWTGRHLGIEWQRDFFEHRLRHDESAREKADYILSNPVRAKLAATPGEWPYVWMGGSVLRTESG